MGGRGVLHSVDYSRDGKNIAAAGEDGRIRIIELKAVAKATKDIQLDSPVRCVRFSPSSNRIAIAMDTWQDPSGGNVAVYDAASLHCLARWQTDAPIGAIHYVNDHILITADWSGRLVGWTWTGLRVTAASPINKAIASAASFSPNSISFHDMTGSSAR
jgi:WD40 repeat protein